MSISPPVIDLIHPTGNQNVRQVLQALDENRLLGTFHTTLGFSNEVRLNFLPGSLRAECLRRTYALSPEKVRRRPWREMVRLAAQKLRCRGVLKHEQGWACIDEVYRDLDRSVAREIGGTSGLTGIYGYEDGCVESFRVAKRNGLQRFYDLPIAYWEIVQKVLAEEKERLPEWEPTLVGTRDSQAKLDRKTEELSLADLVICPSQFVLQSLPEEVRANKRCLVAEFGSPERNLAAARPSSSTGKLRVLFVGSMTQRKGLADLFAAMRLLNRSDVELIVLGSLIAPMEFYRSQYVDFTYEAPRPHREVLEVMQGCDVLVLPSLAEGRALVMQEAMANGLPLIVTENTGGADLIVPGQTGFLVPIRSPEVIAEKLAWLVDHREALPAMRLAALKKADEYSWSRYREQIVSAFKPESP